MQRFFWNLQTHLMKILEEGFVEIKISSIVHWISLVRISVFPAIHRVGTLLRIDGNHWLSSNITSSTIERPFVSSGHSSPFSFLWTQFRCWNLNFLSIEHRRNFLIKIQIWLINWKLCSTDGAGFSFYDRIVGLRSDEFVDFTGSVVHFLESKKINLSISYLIVAFFTIHCFIFFASVVNRKNFFLTVITTNEM